jgi:methionyl-tRNA formyltransferase
MKLIFAGTPDFACESLKAMVAAGFLPALVLTQPDRPAGRGKKITASSVKKFAAEQGLRVQQPETLKNAAVVAELAVLKPDLLIVAAYGLLLPQAVLDIPTIACINVHASLLPRWRGASPIQAAILAGDSKTGISLMQMEAGLDSGPVLAAESLSIGSNETAGSLHDRLATLGGDLLVRTLPKILSGDCRAQAQNPDEVTFARKIHSEDAAIVWSESAQFNARKIRAYNPLPGAWFTSLGERIKCWEAEAIDAGGAAPGTVMATGKEGVVVACGTGALRMTELQRPGRGRISAGELSTQLDLSDKRLS